MQAKLAAVMKHVFALGFNSKATKEKCVLKHSRPPGAREVGSKENWLQVRFHVDICAAH